MNGRWFSIALALFALGSTSELRAQFGGGGGYSVNPPSSIPVGPSRFVRLPDKEAAAKMQQPCVDERMDRTFTDLIDQLKADTGLQVVVDMQHITEAGVDLGSVIEGELRGLSWEDALDMSLSRHGLGYLLSGSTLRITSAEYAKGTMIVATYDIADLLEEGPLGEPSMFDKQSIIDLLVSTTPTGPWKQTDSEGGDMKVAGHQLVVCQNQRNHAVIEETLRQLRQGMTPVGEDLVVVTYRVLAPDTLQGDSGREGSSPLFLSTTAWWQVPTVSKTDPKAEDSEEHKRILTKAVVNGGSERATGFSQSLAEALPKLVVPESWEAEGGAGTVHPVPGALLIRQTPQVHRQIREVLKSFSPNFKVTQPYGLGGGVSATGDANPYSPGGGFFQLPKSSK